MMLRMRVEGFKDVNDDVEQRRKIAACREALPASFS